MAKNIQTLDMADYTQILTRLGKKVVKVYHKDRDHFVTLLEDYYVGRFAKPLPNFENDLILIDHGELWLKANGRPSACDGASFAPDKIGSLDLAVGYIAHDYLYESLEEMSKDPAYVANGYTFDRLRRIADVVLGVKLRSKNGFIARVYFSAVRLLGGVYHWLAHIILIGFMLTVLNGCTGCLAVPDDVFFDDNPTDPVYTVIPTD